mgnify:CR=1 FL=1
MNSQAGSSLFSFMLLSITLPFLFFLLKYEVMITRELKRLLNSQICVREIQLHQLNFQRIMKGFNRTLFALNTGSLFPPAAPAAAKVKKITQKIQDIYFLKSQIEVLNFTQCPHLLRIWLFKNPLYKSKSWLKLTRNPFGLPIKRAKERSLKYPFYSKYKPFQVLHVFKSEITNKYNDLNWSYKRWGKKDLVAGTGLSLQGFSALSQSDFLKKASALKAKEKK